MVLLMIDDDPDTLQMLKLCFEKEGFEVLATSDPDGALILVRQQRISVVLCDIVMGEQDGRQLLSQIKQYRPDLPVFLMSGNPQKLMEATRDGKFDGMFIKPFDAQAAAKRIMIAARKATA